MKGKRRTKLTVPTKTLEAPPKTVRLVERLDRSISWRARSQNKKVVVDAKTK